MQNATPQDLARIRDMMRALNDMLDADARGEHTQEQFDEFMQQYGDFFPDNPQNLDELIDSLARRAAAAQRLMDSLTPEQRAELAALMEQAMRAGRPGRGDGPAAAGRCAPLVPTCAGAAASGWTATSRWATADATGALAELADLDELDELLGQDYPGASLDDIDEELVERALGRSAVDDLAQLRRIERELREQGYLQRGSDGLQLTPRALRRLGSTALRRVFALLESRGRGGHDVRDAGAAGEITGASREWRFGDEQPLDVVRTVRNAVLRTAADVRDERRIRVRADDFEVVETERRSLGGGRAARRHVVLDGAARHVGRGEDDRAGAALAGHAPSTRRTRSRSSASATTPG